MMFDIHMTIAETAALISVGLALSGSILGLIIGAVKIYQRVNSMGVSHEKIIARLESIEEKCVSKFDCEKFRNGCPEVFRMEAVERSIAKLCDALAEQTKKQTQFIESMAEFRGKVVEHMAMSNQLFYQLQKRLDNLNSNMQ